MEPESIENSSDEDNHCRQELTFKSNNKRIKTHQQSPNTKTKEIGADHKYP